MLAGGVSNNVFKRGQELTRSNGLNLFLKTKSGTPINGTDVYYNVYDYTTGSEVLMSPENRKPINPAIGEYYAPLIIPRNSNIGNMRLRWFFREKPGARQCEILQTFSVVLDEVNLVNLPGATVETSALINSLRILLRDNSPARNYHFMPPSGEESVNEFNRVFGYVWEDAELLEYLSVSNDTINMYPPRTVYQSPEQMVTMNRPWRSVLLNGALVYALQALAINWVQDEFNYSIGGVSLDIEKSSKYQSMMGDAQTRFNEMVEKAKLTVKHTFGLKQSRYGVGIRSSFGPSVGRGALTPRRYLGV